MSEETLKIGSRVSVGTKSRKTGELMIGKILSIRKGLCRIKWDSQKYPETVHKNLVTLVEVLEQPRPASEEESK